MIHKFHSRPNGWEGITPHIYKENPGVFRDVTKQILLTTKPTFRYSSVISSGEGRLLFAGKA